MKDDNYHLINYHLLSNPLSSYQMSVKKGLLIFPILKDLNRADGILVKNEGIRNGFLQHNIAVDALDFTSKGVFRKDEQILAFHPNRYRRIYQYNFSAWKTIREFIQREQYDFIWFRVSIITSAVAKFIKQLKKNSPSCKIIIEYGAYPFADELPRLKRLYYYLNKSNEKAAHKAADYVITYCGQDHIDNVPNIPINNGIELDKLTVVKIHTNVNEKINLISVSSLKKWHAYERFLEGLHTYVKNNNSTKVHFNIVGNGPEYEKLTGIVKNYNLERYVTFHSFKTGKELDEIYNDNHVAIGTLGFHRVGISNSSSLKNREYFARGLPIVVSTPDKDMPPSLPYVKYVEEGESNLNIEEIVSFTKNIYNQPGLNQTIRKYAEENVSWKSKIKVVLEYLNK